LGLQSLGAAKACANRRKKGEQSGSQLGENPAADPTPAPRDQGDPGEKRIRTLASLPSARRDKKPGLLGPAPSNFPHGGRAPVSVDGHFSLKARAPKKRHSGRAVNWLFFFFARRPKKKPIPAKNQKGAQDFTGGPFCRKRGPGRVYRRPRP